MHSVGKDEIVGTNQIPLESQEGLWWTAVHIQSIAQYYGLDMVVILSNGEGGPTRPTKLHLTTTFSELITTENDSESAEGPSDRQRDVKSASAVSVSELSLPSTDELDVESSTAAAQLVKNAVKDLQAARMAVHRISASETCRNVIERIQSILEAVRPVAEVRSCPLKQSSSELITSP